MKPLKLTLSAFGPFKDEVTIDFTTFSDQPIFLISGPTGSGKTSIFDAMTYALYGTASGQVRTTDGLKSQYADDGQLCYVDFEFDLAGEIFHVRRSPKQRGPSAAGNIIDLQPQAYLKTPQGTYSMITEVNEKIRDILGLDVNQFRQIVLLPQGEFRQLIDAKTSEREGIFRKIFQTENLKAFEDRLEDQRKVLEKASEKDQAKLQGILDQVEVGDDEELGEALEEESEKQVLEALTSSLEKNEKALQTNQSAFQAKQEESRSIKERLTWLEDLAKNKEMEDHLEKKKDDMETLRLSLNLHEKALVLLEAQEKKVSREGLWLKAKDQLDQSLNKLKDLEAESIDHQEVFSQAKENYQKNPEDRKKLQALDKEKEIYASIDQKRQDLLSHQEKHKHLTSELKKNEERIQKVQEDAQALKEAIQKLHVQEKEDLPSLEEKISDQKGKEESLAKALEDLLDFEKAKKDHQDKSATYIEAEKLYREKEKEYQTLSLAYDRSEVGLLAEQLEEGKPCPVCGSIHHPQPAPLTDLVSQEDLDQALEAFNTASQTFSQSKALTQQAYQTLGQWEDRTGIEARGLEEARLSLEEDLLQVKEEAEDVRVKAQQVKEDLEKLPQLEAQEKAKETEAQDLKIQIEVIQERLKNQEKTGIQLESDLSKLEASLQSESLEKVLAQQDHLEGLLEAREKSYLEADEKRQALDKDLASLQATIQSGRAQLSDRKLEYEEAEEAFRDTLSSSTLDENFSNYLLEEETYLTKQETLKTYDRELVQVQSRIEAVEEKLSGIEDLKGASYYRDQLKVLQDEEKALQSEGQELFARVRSQRKTVEALEAYLESHARLNDQYARVKELSAIASGNDPRAHKVSFERYVLGIYFDEILEAANLRFGPMTNNRYHLRRQQTLRKGNAKQGLDMEVMDEYTGQARDVSTLSGGESFKCSLSLAMGMSDVLQNQQGGTDIQTLFVDEGFGSLDAESLDMAIEVLTDLNAEGRLIGIISHVEELKSRIPAQIHVIPERQGSSIELEVF